MSIAATNGLVGAISTEAEVPYENDKTWTLAVSGGDVAIQRWSVGKAAKVDVYNGPVLDGQEVEIKTQSSTNLLYMTPTTGVTYIDFARKRADSNQ
tara:strand:- start:21089 stop:21376 length:288 start_codon:yes stop_codon:yes gene_type:complete